MGARNDARNVGIELQRYFPYRLAVLAEQVSLAVAAVYATRFHLTRQEWRILAALGGSEEISAIDIGRLVTLDKMQVSRAMRSLEARDIVKRAEAACDRRRRIVTLTRKGRLLYQEIVPLALAREADLLAALSSQEVRQLDAIIAKIAAAAVAAHQQGG